MIYRAQIERWPLLRPFRIARGSKNEAIVVTVEISDGRHTGRGECCPYPRYGETPERILAALQSIDATTLLETDPRSARSSLLQKMPAGSARNALDCALWDLEAKQTGQPVWRLAGLPPPTRLTTCFTLSLDTPDAMAADARAHSACPILKLKLGDSARDAECMMAVREARPEAQLVCDANEGWPAAAIERLAAAALMARIELIEQPLASSDDRALVGIRSDVPFCADESAAPGIHPEALADRYQSVNIKLDKTGGLTAAIDMIAAARKLGLGIMIGSMVSTSLSMAPAALLGPLADWVDLDSPLLLAKDRPSAMTIERGQLSTPSAELWG